VGTSIKGYLIMKLIKTASGKKKIKISKREWKSIGKKAGWMKKAQHDADWQDGEDEYQFHKESLQDSGIEEPTYEQVMKEISQEKEKSAKEDQLQRSRSTIKNILEKFDYDANKIRQAVDQAASNLEGEQGREDWAAEAAPTSQGFMDAQDLQNERVGATADLDNLRNALEMLESLR